MEDFKSKGLGKINDYNFGDKQTDIAHDCFNPLPLLQLLGEPPVFSENIPRTKVLSWS